MSAWIVSKAHIDLLVAGLGERELVVGDPNEIGKTLWRENHRSINYRYNERNRTPAYSFRPVTIQVTDQVLSAALHCYSYQTCERPDYPKTQAGKWVLEAIAVVDPLLPRTSIGSPNYHGEDFAWGYEESDVRPSVAVA